MVFHYRQRDIGNLIPSLKINDEPVERVTEFNFLGLIIDETLSWHPHVQKISNNISRTLGIMGAFEKILTHKHIDINVQLVGSSPSVVWYSGMGSQMTGQTTKCAVRIITCQKYNAHREPLFTKLSLLKQNDIFRLNVLNLYYKFHNVLLPVYVASIFRYDTGNGHYDLRNENVLINPEVRTRSGEYSIRYYRSPAPSDWYKPRYSWKKLNTLSPMFRILY